MPNSVIPKVVSLIKLYLSTTLRYIVVDKPYDIDLQEGREVVLDVMDVPRMIEGLKEIHGSYGAAARACGMPEATMTKLRRGESINPRLDTLELIARGYRKPLSEVIAMQENGGEDTHNDRTKNGA